MLWYERYISLANNNGLDRWQISGPNEIHDSNHGLPQAPFMPEVGLDYRKRINANASLAAARYFDVGPIVLNQWYQYKMGIFYTQSTTGWFEIWRDGVLVIEFNGKTAGESYPAYWKFGNYRNANYSGTSTIDVSGVRVYG